MSPGRGATGEPGTGVHGSARDGGRGFPVALAASTLTLTLLGGGVTPIPVCGVDTSPSLRFRTKNELQPSRCIRTTLGQPKSLS